MNDKLKFKLRHYLTLSDCKNGSLLFKLGRNKEFEFKAGNNDVFELIFHFCKEGMTLEEINNGLVNILDCFHKKRVVNLFENLVKNNLLALSYAVDKENFFQIDFDKAIENFDINSINIEAGTYLISRFSYLVKGNNGFITLKNPLSDYSLSIHGELFIDLLISLFSCGLETNNLFDLNKILLIKFLILGKFIGLGESPIMKSWEFHDLIFHKESRLGKSEDKYFFGATFRFGESSLNEVDFFQKERYSKNRKIFLYKPDQVSCTQSLFSVLEKRRTVRKQGNNPISLHELGEFLYYSLGNSTYRPSPSAGGVLELGFYIICNKTCDADRGVYFYQQDDHSLLSIPTEDTKISDILKIAKVTWGEQFDLPQVLIVVTSIFGKMATKYEKIAYRNTLLNIGATFQTMYLVGTALNLAPCAMGYGNSELFSSIIGSNSLEETSIGEFALGSLS